MEKGYRAILEKFLKLKSIIFFNDFPLKEFSYYNVGGNAEFAVFPNTLSKLKNVFWFCRKNRIPFYILGGGANVIINDRGVKGVVCLTEKLNALKLESGKIYAECGVSLESLSLFAAEKGVSGFEFAYDIPGTVGGALIMNAGNNYGEFAQITCTVRAMDNLGREWNFKNKMCEFGYRSSIFKKKKLIILSAEFNATKRKDRRKIYSLCEKIKKERADKFPLEYPNAGSVFKRPKGYYAGKLIEDAGCGGLKVGDAMVSLKHKGFIVNLGNATADDIKNLISLVQQKVYLKFGVKLEREQIFFPEDLI